jgi:Na+/H+ antiporter NhaC
MSLALYVAFGIEAPEAHVSEVSEPWLVLPYIVIIITALMGINVTLVLLSGIVVTIVLALCMGHNLLDLFGYMGSGIDSVGNLIIVTLLAAGMLGLIKAAGGIDYLLQVMTRRISGTRGGQASIAMLVSVVNLCTANNTVAIITTGPLAKSISDRYNIDPRKSASLLDTCSCIVQGLIPYGAQTLLATALAGISPVAPWPYMYYPWAMAIMVVFSIVANYPRRVRR